MTDPRDLSAVDRFAVRMRLKLRANDHKGHWGKCTPDWLLGCLRVEVRELVDALDNLEREKRQGGNGMLAAAVGEVVSECCDVAAFAMMIADVVGGLPEAARAPVAVAHADTPLADALRDAERAWKRVAVLEARIAEAERALAGHGRAQDSVPAAPAAGAAANSASPATADAATVETAGTGIRSAYAPEPDEVVP